MYSIYSRFLTSSWILTIYEHMTLSQADVTFKALKSQKNPMIDYTIVMDMPRT